MKTSSGSVHNVVQSPANIRMKLKILPIFVKSESATNTFPSCIQVFSLCIQLLLCYFRLCLMVYLEMSLMVNFNCLLWN